VKLLSTCVATMEDAHAFGKLARLEAEKRGIRKAVEVIASTMVATGSIRLWETHFGPPSPHPGYYHAAEHLHEAARAACPTDKPAADQLADSLVQLLWDGPDAATDRTTDPTLKRSRAAPETDPQNHPPGKAAGQQRRLL